MRHQSRVALGNQTFRRDWYKKQSLQDFEKPDIVDFCEHLGIDLTIHEGSDKPYLNGPCPLHAAERNMTTFVVWPEIQRCQCMSCTPGQFMDVIDLYRKIYNCDFETAKANICTPITGEHALIKQLQEDKGTHLDLRIYAERIYFLWDRVDFDLARSLQLKVHEALAAGQPALADQILRRYGV